MYKVELNITSLTSPVVNGDYLEVDCSKDSAGLSKDLEGDQIFARLKMTGSIEFLGKVFTALNILRLLTAKIKIRITHTDNSGNESIQYIGDLNLWGEYKENACILKAETDDEYMILMTDKTKKVNILNTLGGVKCDVEPTQSRLTFSTDTFTQGASWYYWATSSPILQVYAREEKIYPDHIADLFDGTDGWIIIESHSNGTKTIARSWVDGGFDSVIITDLLEHAVNAGVTNHVNEIISIDGVEYTITAIDENSDIGLLLKNGVYYGSSPINFDRFRHLNEVIKFLVNEIDSSIQFDTDSFTYLDGNEDLQFLLMINIADMMTLGGVQTPTIAEFGNITFEKLMKMLRDKFKIYWRLEKISTIYYFRLKHRSEVNYAVGTLDLTDVNGRNYAVRDVWKYNTVKKFNRLEREAAEAGNFDFIGEPILIPTLDNVVEEEKITDDSFFYDVWHILDLQGESYPESSDNEFALISAEPLRTDDIDLLTGMTNVGFESFSFAAGTLTAQNTSSWALANSIAFSTIAGYVYKVTLNLTALTGNAPMVTFSNSVNISGIPLESGINTFYSISEDNYNSIAAITIIADGISSFTIEDMSIKREVFNCRIREGALTSDQIANAELSIANLDAGHAQYEMPDSVIEVNGEEVVLTSLQRLKDKSQEVGVPLYDVTAIDEEKLIISNKGNIEFRSLSIKLDGSMPELKGDFI